MMYFYLNSKAQFCSDSCHSRYIIGNIIYIVGVYRYEFEIVSLLFITATVDVIIYNLVNRKSCGSYNFVEAC